MNIVDIIKGYEGLKLKLYKCSSGKLTIGYGHNLDDKGITKDQAEYILFDDIADAELDIKLLFWGGDWMGENRWNALVDLMFNLGKTKFLTFKKMIQAIKEGDWNKAADELLDSKYATQVGQRALDNAKRLREG